MHGVTLGSVAQVKKAFNKVKWAVSDARPMLETIRIEVNGNCVRFTGADGHILADMRYKIHVIYPTKTVFTIYPNDLENFLANAWGGVRVEIDATANMTRWTSDSGLTYVCTQASAKWSYPDIDTYIDRQRNHAQTVVVDVDRNALKHAMRVQQSIMREIEEKRIRALGYPIGIVVHKGCFYTFDEAGRTAEPTHAVLACAGDMFVCYNPILVRKALAHCAKRCIMKLYAQGQAMFLENDSGLTIMIMTLSVKALAVNPYSLSDKE